MVWKRRRRASVIVAGHNEGELLLHTVASCLEAARELDCEVVVADDASTDGSVQAVRTRFPSVRVAAHRRRRGVSPTKHLGARHARGRVLVFIDGHCKPELRALEQLVFHMENLEGRAILMPSIPVLDVERWENSRHQIGYGFCLRALAPFECGWLPLSQLRRSPVFDRYYESPALIGCCMAVSRRLYRELWGFDAHMVEWGVEDIDFGLKAWLLGYPLLLIPEVAIGHRFRAAFTTFSVTPEAVLYNQMRMARKNFSDTVWHAWLDRMRERYAEPIWSRAWSRLNRRRRSLERERRYLARRRVYDETWYARTFGLELP